MPPASWLDRDVRIAAEGDPEQKEVIIDVLKDIVTGQLPLIPVGVKTGMFSAELQAELLRIATKLLMSR